MPLYTAPVAQSPAVAPPSVVAVSDETVRDALESAQALIGVMFGRSDGSIQATIDTQEALRLLSALNEAVGQYAEAIRNDKRNGMTGVAAAKVDSCVDKLRALLSAKEGEDEQRIRYLGLTLLHSAHLYRNEEDNAELVADQLDAMYKTGNRYEQDYRDGAKHLAACVPLWPAQLRDAEKEKGNAS
jgi:hypothetical protein